MMMMGGPGGTDSWLNYERVPRGSGAEELDRKPTLVTVTDDDDDDEEDVVRIDRECDGCVGAGGQSFFIRRNYQHGNCWKLSQAGMQILAFRLQHSTRGRDQNCK